jgi:ligand-binding sensor domain-containing protein
MQRTAHFNFFIAFMLLFCTLQVAGQQYHLKNYSIDDGLTGISVSCLLQDSRGYIWIGTDDGGISRFDGKTFVNYTNAMVLATMRLTVCMRTKKAISG